MKRILSLLASVLLMCGLSSLSPLLAGTSASAPAPAPTTIDLSFALTGTPVAKAISYAGYRDGQKPGGIEPSYAEILEDLTLLSKHFNILRMYGAGSKSETVLKVIDQEKLPLKVMQGAWLAAEVNNPNSPWAQPLSPEKLAANIVSNRAEVERAIALAKKYPHIITAVSVGNEILVDWTDHVVPLESLLDYVKTVKSNVTQLVTVADNYVPWRNGQERLVEQLDFITIHSYPIWEYKTIEQALPFTIENYESVTSRYPGKPVAIGEAGWTTGTNGVQIAAAVATEPLQKIYFEQFSKWTQGQGIVGFWFSAFDENWKGGTDPAEPEKHWGLFHADRTPKEAICALYPAPIATDSVQQNDANQVEEQAQNACKPAPAN